MHRLEYSRKVLLTLPYLYENTEETLPFSYSEVNLAGKQGCGPFCAHSGRTRSMRTGKPHIHVTVQHVPDQHPKCEGPCS